MLEHVARAIDARRLAVPDAEHAIELCARKDMCLLRAPYRRRAEVLVQALPQLHVVRVHQLAGGADLLVVAAQRRAAITRNEPRRIQAQFAVQLLAVERQPHKRLDARHEGAALLQQVLVIEGNSTRYRATVLQVVRLRLWNTGSRQIYCPISQETFAIRCAIWHEVSNNPLQTRPKAAIHGR